MVFSGFHTWLSLRPLPPEVAWGGEGGHMANALCYPGSHSSALSPMDWLPPAIGTAITRELPILKKSREEDGKTQEPWYPWWTLQYMSCSDRGSPHIDALFYARGYLHYDLHNCFSLNPLLVWIYTQNDGWLCQLLDSHRVEKLWCCTYHTITKQWRWSIANQEIQ